LGHTKARAQPEESKRTEVPLLSQVKVEKNDNKFKVLANFVHTTRSKCYWNIIIPSQLTNFVVF